MAAPRRPISIEPCGDGVRVRAPLAYRSARRTPLLAAIGTVSAGGIGAVAIAAHDVVPAIACAALATLGTIVLALVFRGTSTASLDRGGASFAQLGVATETHRGRPVAVAFGTLHVVGRYANGAFYPIAVRFEDGASVTLAVDAASPAEAERVARDVAARMGLEVEAGLPRRPVRHAGRLTAILTAAVLAPVLALMVWLFVSTHRAPHGADAVPASEPSPDAPERTALPAPVPMPP